MAHVFVEEFAELSPWIRSEIKFTAPLSRGALGKPVRRAQEWLNLHGAGLVVDGAFGPATRRAVTEFQSSNGLERTGEVDEPTFGRFVAPMADVLRQRLTVSVPLAEALVEYARAHLAARPREVGGPNAGPWVRLYMNGRQGEAFAWCAGFVTFLLEQAAQSLEVDMPLPGSVSTDALALHAEHAGLLLSGDGAAGKITPGCLFLIRRADGDWNHTGIVTAVYDEPFSTIEGNTNDAGQREGVEVCARTRAFHGNPPKDFIHF